MRKFLRIVLVAAAALSVGCVAPGPESQEPLAQESVEAPETEAPEAPLKEYEATSLDGGSIVTELGYGIAINRGSDLNRTWYVLNTEGSPLRLTNAGIDTRYDDRSYEYFPTGQVTTSTDVSAFEVRFLLFDVFGEHMQSLSGTEIRSLEADETLDLSEIGVWRAWENGVSEFLTSVV